MHDIFQDYSVSYVPMLEDEKLWINICRLYTVSLQKIGDRGSSCLFTISSNTTFA